MGKVQQAIDASRKLAQQSNRGVHKGRSLSSPLRKTVEPLQCIDSRPAIDMDPECMERSCLLPFVDSKAGVNAYRVLRTRVLKRMWSNDWNSLIVTGSAPGDGKTTTAINLAITASQDVNQSVLLVDFDLERPAMAQRLGLEKTVGLSDYLCGNAELEEIFYNTDVNRLFVVPSFERTHLSESFISPKVLALLDHVKELGPNLLTIFDMPPITSSDNVLAMVPYADTLLLVVSEGQTNRSLLRRAIQMIEDIPRVGTVLNRSVEGGAGSYY